MRCRHFCIFVNRSVAKRSRGCSLMRYRLFFNALYEQPRALCHAPLTNIQKCLRRIFATLYFVRSFFDDLFLQWFIFAPQFFLTIWFCNGVFCAVFFLFAKINSQKNSAQKNFLHIYFCTNFFLHIYFCIFN